MSDFKSEITKKIQDKIKTKEDKNMKNINWETVKTVVIAILITGVVAFIAGYQYHQIVTQEIETKAATIVKNVQVNATVAPSK